MPTWPSRKACEMETTQWMILLCRATSMRRSCTAWLTEPRDCLPMPIHPGTMLQTSKHFIKMYGTLSTREKLSSSPTLQTAQSPTSSLTDIPKISSLPTPPMLTLTSFFSASPTFISWKESESMGLPIPSQQPYGILTSQCKHPSTSITTFTGILRPIPPVSNR